MEDGANAKKQKNEDTTKSPEHDKQKLSLAGFKFCKLLKNDLRSKTVFIHSTFDGKDAVILMEKTAFEADTVQELLTDKTKLVTIPKNVENSTHTAFPDKTFDG